MNTKQQETASQRIELLSLDLFQTHREEIQTVEAFQRYFDAALGWHYFLDLAWVVREVRTFPRGAVLLDAGAGCGILQLILAELGYNVISADFMGRGFPAKYVERYQAVTHPLNSQRNSVQNSYTRHLKAVYSGQWSRLLSSFLELFRSRERFGDCLECIEKHRFAPATGAPAPLLEGDAAASCGTIFLYKCDLKDMALLPDALVDGVVSVSALEHNDHEGFENCMSELLRVTKPSGKFLVTVSAAQSEDWFHNPSKGWCYSEATLKRLFRLPQDVPSNFSRKDEFFAKLREQGNELHQRLAPVYFESGQNGMPWGVWDPLYQPVGIVKVKP